MNSIPFPLTFCSSHRYSFFYPIEDDYLQEEEPTSTSIRAGYVSTVHFSFKGEDLEFSSGEPELSKKKAEHKAAEVCINALESKYNMTIRPNEQNKSSLAQVCGYGIIDEKNPDSVALFNLTLGEKEFLPLGALLFIKSIQSAVNKQDSHDVVKNPHTSYKVLEDELHSPRNVLSNEDPSEPLVHIQTFGIQTVVKPNINFISSEQCIRIATYKKRVFEHGLFNKTKELKFLKVVYIPSKVPSPSSSDVSSRIVITETEIAKGHCLETLEEIRRLLRADNVTMSAPFKPMKSASQSSVDSLISQYSKMNVSEISEGHTRGAHVSSSDDGQGRDIKGEDEEPVNTSSSSTPTPELWRQKKGPRFFLSADPTDLAKNELVSWIIGSPCYGDAVFAFLEPTEACDVSIEHVLNILTTYTPIGLMSTQSPIFSIPSKYFADNFETLGLHTPMTVLSEIMSKRANINGTVYKPEITYTTKVIEPNKSVESGKQELGEDEYTLLRPIQSFIASCKLPPASIFGSSEKGEHIICTSDERPNKQEASQALALQVLNIMQQNCNEFFNKIHILKIKEDGKYVLYHYPNRSRAPKDTSEDALHHISRCFLADIDISYVVSEGYEYNNPIVADSDYESGSEFGDSDMLQPVFSIFEMSTANEEILGSGVKNMKYANTLIGIGNLPFSIEMGLFTIPTGDSPMKLAVAPILIPPWWQRLLEAENSSSSSSSSSSPPQVTFPKGDLALLSDNIQGAEVVDITLKAVISIKEIKSPYHCYDALENMKREASVKFFDIPLSVQRHKYISDVMRGVHSLVDVGCGGGDFLLKAIDSSNEIFFPSLKNITGIDVNEIRLKKIQSTMSKSIHVHPTLQNMQLWTGSMLEKPFLDKLRASIDVFDLEGVVCIEVIEHLPSIQDAVMGGLNVLMSLQPRIAIFTTPNYEANFTLATAANSNVPKNDKNMKFREADHKFEFTRKEFLSWIDEVLSFLSDACPTLKYNFEVFEVGDLSRYQGGESCGGATQGVKFIRSGDSEIKISSPQSEGGEEEYAPLMNWKKSLP